MALHMYQIQILHVKKWLRLTLLVLIGIAIPINRPGKTPIKPWITPGILASINRKNELFTVKNNYASETSTAKLPKVS